MRPPSQVKYAKISTYNSHGKAPILADVCGLGLFLFSLFYTSRSTTTEAPQILFPL